MKTFSIGEAIRFGWEKTKANFSKVFTILLVLLFLNLVMSFLNKAIHRSDALWDTVVYAFTMFGFLIIEVIVAINIIKQGLVVSRGGEADVSKILDPSDTFFLYIIGQILVGLIIVVGFILVIIPGIIAALILCFTKPIIVDLKLDPIATISKGREMTRGHLWELFSFFLVLALLNIAGAIVIGIGLIVTLPISFFAYLYVYDRLLIRGSEPSAAPQNAA